ncbi:TPA: HAD hydrolase family protein [Legionella pneumophila]|nr:HAD hydrolase family protein [Legionella pneumophila]
MNDINQAVFLTALSNIKMVIFDFDGVFTDNTVFISQEGIESICCWRSDGLGLTRLKSIGILPLILSTEANPVVSVRASKLKIECWQGIENKALAIEKICQEYEIKLSEIAFVGNDINDICAFKIVGVPIAVGDAYPEVFPYIMYQTKKHGGRGAVREVCDLIYQVKTTV